MSMMEKIEGKINKGEGVELSLALHEWIEEGTVLYGQLESFEDFTSGDFDTICQRYTFRTDDGRVSCVLGQVGDRALHAETNIGKYFRILFKGKKQGKKGQPFNDFSIVCIPDIGK